MEIVVSTGDLRMLPSTARLLNRTLCPLSGLVQTIGFVMRGNLEPRVAIAGGEMTGMHVLRGTPEPPAGSYHIGGSGTTYEETVIRTLGETLERYAQLMAMHAQRHAIETASMTAMTEAGRRCLVPADLRWFSDEQHASAGFPFSLLGADDPIGWVAGDSLLDDGQGWVPAQQAFVGYLRRHAEPRFALGVSTGTATHSTPAAAVRNALLEIIQIDAAMGHWYGDGNATVIEPGRRTRSLDALLTRVTRDGGPNPRFVLMHSADLPGFPVACLIESDDVPRCAVGLGCDLTLESAMHKAYLEGVAVAQLAKVILFRQSMDLDARPGPPFYDLDSNVGHYATRPGVVRRRFARAGRASADDLAPDSTAVGAPDAVRELVGGFSDSDKDLVALDLTTADIKTLGYCVVRTYSPDALALPLPSAPPLQHPRLQAYGGVACDNPHPYP